jgi:hypothetical protein
VFLPSSGKPATQFNSRILKQWEYAMGKFTLLTKLFTYVL